MVQYNYYLFVVVGCNLDGDNDFAGDWNGGYVVGCNLDGGNAGNGDNDELDAIMLDNVR